MEVGKRGAAGAARSAQRREMRKGCATSATKEHTTGNYSVCTLCTDRSRPGNGHVRGGVRGAHGSRCALATFPLRSWVRGGNKKGKMTG
eukprot:gene12533-biopygen16943